jgi:hypothetical protein
MRRDTPQQLRKERMPIITCLIKEDPVYKQYVEISIVDGKVTGFRAYNHYFDPMGSRRRPIHDVPVFVSQAVLNKAREQAKKVFDSVERR